MSGVDCLPDGVMCLIFSKLCMAQSLALCSTVCRRWRDVCRSVDTLIFESFELLGSEQSKMKASCMEEVVSSMLLKSVGVKTLKVAYHPVVWPWIHGDYFSEDKVCAWINHVQPYLEKLTLVDPNIIMPQPKRLICLSSCGKLQFLSLCYGFIPNMPPECMSFASLKSCTLDLVEITDGALMDIVVLCPLLEDLKLNSCSGLQNPHIRASNLKSLQFLSNLGYVRPIQRVCVDAPKLVRVCLSYVKELMTDADGLSELGLMCHVKPRIHSLPSLDKLHLQGQKWELESISEYIRLAPNVREMHIDVSLESKSPLRLDYIFEHLQNLKSLYIGSELYECLQAGTRFNLDFLLVNLPLLESVTVVIIYGSENCINVLEMFLKCSTSLQRLHINADLLESSSKNLNFFSRVLALQRTYAHVEITLTCPQTLL